MIRNRNRAVLGVLFMVFLFFVILMIFASYTMKIFKDESSAVGLLNKKGQIAVVEVTGPIMDSKKTVELLHKAEEDKTTKAIILRINSPGGAVGPTQEIFEEIRRIDQAYTDSKGKESKPIYGSFGSIAASGGYYLGAATRKIYSPAGALTGSIGVIMNLTDLSKLYEFAKVKPTPLKAGRYKDVGSPHRAMTEEEKGLMSGMMNSVHKQFVKDILIMRKDRIKGDIWDHAQGQIFSGEEALKIGLIDEIGSLWSAGRKIHKELDLKGDFGLKYIKIKKKNNVWDLLENIDQAVTNLRLKTSSSSMPLFLFDM